MDTQNWKAMFADWESDDDENHRINLRVLDHDESRDYLYALETPVHTVAPPLESESEAGLYDFDRRLQE